jgi:hypothetical protein
MAMSTLTVSGLKPALNILGDTQNFIFTPNNATLGVQTTFVPMPNVPSVFSWQFQNSNLAGFRYVHTTNSTDTVGIFTFQAFNPSGVGLRDTIDLLTLSADGVQFGRPAAFPLPVLPTDAANKAYVDQQLSTVPIGPTESRPANPQPGQLFFNTTP